MKNFLQKNSKIILVVIVLLLGVLSWHFLYTKGTPKTSEQLAKEEAIMLTERVGKLIILPSDEFPTIATVTDPSILKNQAFFASANKGDKVLIYSKARKAILYDPVLNKVKNVTNLSITPKDVDGSKKSN